jgi:hypothetical protein
MNKNIVKIVIKSIISVNLLGFGFMVFLGALLQKTEDYGIDSDLEYIYENGAYNRLNQDFTFDDASDEKYNDDWLVNEAYNLRYDYKIYQKLYMETGDYVYDEKLQKVEERLEACLSEVEDEYKRDVIQLFIDRLEEE